MKIAFLLLAVSSMIYAPAADIPHHEANPVQPGIDVQMCFRATNDSLTPVEAPSETVDPLAPTAADKLYMKKSSTS